MTSENYKLICYNIKGLQEGFRYIFRYSGVECSEKRYILKQWPTDEDAIAAKLTPILEVTKKTVKVGGDETETTILTSGHTIGRFLAAKFDLKGKTSWDSSQCDVIFEMLNYIIEKAVCADLEPTATKKAKLLLSLQNDVIPSKCSKLEKKLKTSTADGGVYFLGETISWVDFVCAYLIRMLLQIVGKEFIIKLMGKYPRIIRLAKNVEEQPAVSAYLRVKYPEEEDE